VRTRIAQGTVTSWHGDLGWGVLASPDVPGEVWAHFSAVEGSGYHTLVEGADVRFEYQKVHNQDGYRYVADSVTRL
jgi:CspA family cold shock protein